MPKEEIEDFKSKLDYIIKILSQIEGLPNAKKKVITNDELVANFGISKKTAQNWRTGGLIRFMRVGRKIYYNLDDVHEALDNHAFDSFKNKHKTKNKSKN